MCIRASKLLLLQSHLLRLWTLPLFKHTANEHHPPLPPVARAVHHLSRARTSSGQDVGDVGNPQCSIEGSCAKRRPQNNHRQFYPEAFFKCENTALGNLELTEQTACRFI